LRVNKGGVLIVGLEGQRGLENRLLAQRMHHHLDGEDVPLAVWQAPIDFGTRNSKDAHLFAQTVLQEFDIAPSLIVIDTLARAMGGGNENGPNDMGCFIKSIGYIQEEVGSHVLVVHHIGKDAERGPRGHSSLRAAADTMVEIQRPDGAKTSVATVIKQKDGPEGAAYEFKLRSIQLGLDEDGDPVTTCIVEHINAEEVIARRRQKLSGPQQRAFDILQRLIIDHGKPTEYGHEVIPDKALSVALGQWRDECKRAGLSASESPAAQRKAVQRAMDDLVNIRVVGKYDEQVWLC
jgi:hypothetical protein